MLSYRNRLLLIGSVVTIAVLGTVFLQAPEPTLTIDELMENKSKHMGEEVAVRGEIRDGSINESSMTFILEGSEFSLLIDYSNAGSISNGLGDNRTVYAEGLFKLSDDSYVVEADVIKTSCPSKYEEEV
ncbi:MAG: cytochrome c maturation protein CcmE [Candidatus Poseidoniaceae archaeon]|nr:cytochrome c maturation protein CcmE [Candidatus Poseidoniaceae archaeon]